MRKIGMILAGASCAAGLSSLASAAEYCVTCEGPPGLYRCVIDGTPEGPGKDPATSVHCISQIAKQGKHERCAVSRAAPYPCPGLTALVPPPSKGVSSPAVDHAAPYPEPQAPRVALPADGEHEADAAVAAQEPSPSPSKVPRTVEELAGQTVRSSKEGLEKAGRAIGGTAQKAGEVVGQTGSAIGNAASNTWSCLTSFFTACGGEPEADTHDAAANSVPDEAAPAN